MSLKIIIEGKDKNFSEINREQKSENNIVFKITSPDSEKEYSFPTAFPNTDIKNTTKVFLFKNDYFKADDIVELKIKKGNALRFDGKPALEATTIGCFFSTLLFNEENSIIKDAFDAVRYSEIYALSALEVILKNEQGKVSFSPKILSDSSIIEADNLTIKDLYGDDDLVILSINEKLLKHPDRFNIDAYLCHLYKYGFYLLTKHETKVRYNKLPIISKNYKDAEKKKRIIATKTSNVIDFAPNSFYQTLLHELIQQDSKFPTAFIVLYQVIELLKDRVLKNQIRNLPSYDDDKSGDELRKGVNKKIDKRDDALIKKLFNSDDFQLNENNKIFLKEQIEEFLKKSEIPTKQEVTKSELVELEELVKKFKSNKGNDFYDGICTTIQALKQQANDEKFASILYKFRNIIVHNYSVILEKNIDESLINNIRMSFEYLIIDLLHTYKEKNETTKTTIKNTGISK